MSIEEDPKGVLSYQEIVDEISQNGYYSLPAGTVVDIKFVSGKPVETPITDIDSNATGEAMHSYTPSEVKEISQIELTSETMIGGIASHHFDSGETQLEVTSPALIDAQKRLDGWLSNLAKEHRVPDQYIDEEHEEEQTGPVDISLYVHDHPGVGDGIQKEEKELKEERNRLRSKAEVEFLSNIGQSVPEDEVLLKLSIFVNAK